MIDIAHDPEGGLLSVMATYATPGEEPITVVADSEEAAVAEIHRERERRAWSDAQTVSFR